MRILATCSMGGAGHLNPLLPVLGAAHRRDDKVLLVAPESMRRLADDARLDLVCGDDPPSADVAAIRERLPRAPAAEAVILGNRELFGRLAARALLPTVTDVVTNWRPDLIVREPAEYASAVVAARVGMPMAQVAISSAAAERASLAAAAPALEELRSGTVPRILASPYLTRFPASLDRSAFPTTIRFREAVDRPRPLPDWWAGSPQPLVYLSFGSVFGYLADAATAYRMVIDALAELPVRILVSVGRGVEPSALGPLPPNAHVEQWIDQNDALAAADLMVCHGGSGTVYGALAAGLPLVVMPSFADQFANGHTIADAGAGLTVEGEPDPATGSRPSFDTSRAHDVAAAVAAVLDEPAFRVAAQGVAVEMAAAPVIDAVLAKLIDDGSRAATSSTDTSARVRKPDRPPPWPPASRE